MEWKIRESGRGGYVADLGIEHKGGVEVGYRPGVTMRGFIVYESHHFDTLKEAQRYVKSRS